MSLLEILPFLLQTAPAVKTGLKGRDLKKQGQITDQMSNLVDAQTNMDNPLYQRMYEQERGAGQQDLAATIAEISRQNRKLTSMGRKPLMDQERGGESVFRNLIMGQQNVGNQARQNTLVNLRSAQNANAGLYNSYNDLTANRYDNDVTRARTFSGLGDALKSLFGLGNQSQLGTR